VIPSTAKSGRMWRVLGHAEASQMDQGISQQLHTIEMRSDKCVEPVANRCTGVGVVTAFVARALIA
jgi:hypothetical protein